VRVIYFLFLQCSFIFSSAQSIFSSQLKAIIGDSTNKFQKFKASFKELQLSDSVFHSNITLSGTKDNDIMVTKGMTLYRTIVIDSVTERKGKKIINEWQEKILQTLGGRFTLEKTKIQSWNPTKYGWKFNCGNVSVNLDLYPHNPNFPFYWVCLGVTYFSKEIQ